MRYRQWALGLGPLFFLVVLLWPVPGLTFAGRVVLALALWMSVWWITEAIPIPATSLLPLVVLPLFGVAKAREVAAPYADPNIFLFLGGFFIAKAMEAHGLHRRIALHILSALRSTSESGVILGFMLATAFLSMWISNTATTMMMFPMAMAVVALHRSASHSFDKALLLGIAYSASIGGIATLVGTPPNIVFAGQARELAGLEVTFARWLAVGVPLVILFLPIAWWVLTRWVFGVQRKQHEAFAELIAREKAALPAPTVEEKFTLAVFVVVALLWIFRKSLNLGFVTIPGWSDLLGIRKTVHDSTVAMLGALLLFAVPLPGARRRFVLDWETALKVPWGVVLLFGGGFALAKAFGASGLSQWIGQALHGLAGLPVPLIVATTALLVTFLTELTSNTATATLLLPIAAAAARGIGLHPFVLMLPATLSASCAFMLPVATPPNAIVFGSERLEIRDMARAGIWLNLIGVAIVTFVVLVFGRFLY